MRGRAMARDLRAAAGASGRRPDAVRFSGRHKVSGGCRKAAIKAGGGENGGNGRGGSARSRQAIIPNIEVFTLREGPALRPRPWHMTFAAKRKPRVCQ